MASRQIFILALAIAGYNANVVISHLPAISRPETLPEFSNLPGVVVPGDNVVPEYSNLPGVIAPEFGHLPSNVATEVGHLPGVIAPEFGHLPSNVATEIGHLPGIVAPEYDVLPEMQAQPPVPKCAGYLRSLLQTILAKLPSDEPVPSLPEEYLPGGVASPQVPETDLPSVQTLPFQNPCVACFKHIQLMVEKINSHNSITTF